MRKTFFIDIDGTVLYQDTPEEQERYGPEQRITDALPGALDKLKELEAQGHCIVFVSARKESLRDLTVKQLGKWNLPYDHLIMGIGQGERVLINNRKTGDKEDRARAFNVNMNEGLTDLLV